MEMNTPGLSDNGTVSAGHRRVRYTLSTSVLALTVTACCVLGILLGERFPARLDLTRTREHTLAPRTLRVLDSLEGPHRIIVSADLSQLDRESQQRIADLLEEFQARSGQVAVDWIDASQIDAFGRYTALLDELATRHAGEIEHQAEQLTGLANEIEALVGSTSAVSAALQRLHQSLIANNETNLEEQATLVRSLGSRLEPTIEPVREAAQSDVGGVPLPAIDLAKQAALDPIDELTRAMDAIARFSEDLAIDQSASAATRDAASELVALARTWRDRGARAKDTLARLRPTDPLIVGRILAASDAVLVSSSESTLAIDFESILPSREMASTDDDLTQRVVFAGEQLIATALGALNQSRTPIVALVHAENATLVDEYGGPTSLGQRAFGRLFEQARLTRMDIMEWAVARDALRPDASEVDPSGERPVVWIVLGAPSPVGVDPRQPGAAAERNVRVDKLGEAARTLLEADENVLFSIEPSDYPGVGEADPVGAALEPYGIHLDSGRPLLASASSPSGVQLFTHQIIRELSTEHPIGEAVSGLALALSWMTPIDVTSPTLEGARSGVLGALPRDTEAWAESQWLAVRGAQARSGQSPFQPLLLSNPPAPDPARDGVRPPDSGWVVAAWATRAVSGDKPQRIIVVSSPSWLFDPHVRASTVIQNRRVLRFPGNSELMDASINWLAHLDDLIAPGPEVRDIPRVRRFERGPLTWLRGVVILAPPLLVLIAGGMRRMTRR